MGNIWRGVTSAPARQARAAATAAAAAATTTAACAAPLYDGLHHGMCLLERFVLLIRTFKFQTEQRVPEGSPLDSLFSEEFVTNAS